MEKIVDDSVTLNDRVHDTLRGAILRGELRSGDLHSVAELAERLGVSRTPVREALVRLSDQHMVKFERNRGARILQMSPRDIEEMYGVRLLLEVPATFRAAQTASVEIVSELQNAYDALAAATDSEDVRNRIAVDSAFHEVILRAAGNSRLADYVHTLRDLQMLRGTSAANRGLPVTDILHDHGLILERIRGNDPKGAAAAMYSHLARTLDAHAVAETGSSASDRFHAGWLCAWDGLPDLKSL